MPSAADQSERQVSKRAGAPKVFARIACAVLALAIFVLVLPYLIVPVYRVLDPISTLMLARRLSGAPVQSTFVPIGQMPPILPTTVIAAEDGRFCTHHGIDWRAMVGRLEMTNDISKARGASTITQQLAKNLFLWTGHSFLRKGLELPLALWIDFVLPKRRVLELYLNVVEWGPHGEFGAEAASRYAFNKSVRSLGGHEAGLLAAVLPNPRRRSARTPSPLVRHLAGVYQSRAAMQAGLAYCARAPARSQVRSVQMPMLASVSALLYNAPHKAR